MPAFPSAPTLRWLPGVFTSSVSAEAVNKQKARQLPWNCSEWITSLGKTTQTRRKTSVGEPRLFRVSLCTHLAAGTYVIAVVHLRLPILSEMPMFVK